VTNPGKLRKDRKDVIGDAEFKAMLLKASRLPYYFELRLTALLCLLRLTGKRRGEIAKLETQDFDVQPSLIAVTFTLEKKRRGSVLSHRVTKGLPLSDPLTTPILEYLNYLKSLEPVPKFFFPSGHAVFGTGYAIDPDNQLSGRHVLSLVRQVSDMAWPHLFRETAGAEIIKNDPTIIGVFKVKQRLDHEDLKTSMRYLQRYAMDVIDRESES
jgi:integrase